MISLKLVRISLLSPSLYDIALRTVFTSSAIYHFSSRESFYIECLRGQQLRDTKNTTPLSPSQYSSTQVPLFRTPSAISQPLVSKGNYKSHRYIPKSLTHHKTHLTSHYPLSITNPPASSSRLPIAAKQRSRYTNSASFIHDNTNQINRAHTYSIQRSITDSTLSEHI